MIICPTSFLLIRPCDIIHYSTLTVCLLCLLLVSPKAFKKKNHVHFYFTCSFSFTADEQCLMDRSVKWAEKLSYIFTANKTTWNAKKRPSLCIFSFRESEVVALLAHYNRQPEIMYHALMRFKYARFDLDIFDAISQWLCVTLTHTCLKAC